MATATGAEKKQQQPQPSEPIIAPETRDLRPVTCDLSPVTCSKNKCGPGQPPGPHSVWRYILRPFSTHEAWGEFIFHGAPRNADCDALGRSPPAKRTSQVDLQHHGGRRPVLPCVEDSWRRPQRPGNQSRAEARSWRIPPSNSPSRITGHRRLCRSALAGHAEHLARMSALCARHAHRFKGKPGHGCAETVDAVDSLWKLVEN